MNTNNASAAPGDEPPDDQDSARTPCPEEFQAPDGTTHGVRRVRLPTGEQFEAELIALPRPMAFDRCPICLGPDPAKKEHVPPESVGGKFMTWTCERCNSLAGTRLEDDFADWFHDRVRTRFSHPDFQGDRRGPRMQVLETADGQAVFFLDGERGSGDPAVRQMLEADGRTTIRPIGPDLNRALLAGLKSAYLAACLLLRSIPETPEALAIRRAIIAGIAAPRRQPVPMNDVAQGMWFARIPGGAVPGEVALVHITFAGHQEPRFAFSFARRILVSWPVGGNLVGLDDNQNTTFVRPM